MRLNAPTKIVFWISVILAAVGLLDQFGVLDLGLEYWLTLGGFALLALGNVLKGF